MAIATEYWKVSKDGHEMWLTREGVLQFLADFLEPEGFPDELAYQHAVRDNEHVIAKFRTTEPWRITGMLCGLTDGDVEFFGGAAK